MTLLQPTLIDFINFAPQEKPSLFWVLPKILPTTPIPHFHKFWATFPLFCKMSYFTKKMGEMIILKSKINYEDGSGGDTGLPELMVKLLYIDFRCS